ncbi:MAG TPA: helix-turn-helix transcriptional regulator [Candidatus Acidoferrales bacterium]|nr:helix-turn-helix transcriptional regulator [Candidatus Acidoferrales bacterium]
MRVLGKYFAESIRTLRVERLRTTQQELAHRLGCSIRALLLWEHGQTVPQAKYLTKLAELAPDLFEMVELPPDAEDRQRRERLRQEVHEAIDLIFERAPETLLNSLVDQLRTKAGKWASRKG